MKIFKISMFLVVMLFISNNIFSQEVSKPFLKLKVSKITSFYRDLITDDRGVVSSDTKALIALNNVMKDSVIDWSKKFNLATPEGFSDFGTFVGDKLKIKAGKKIELTFIDTENKKKESYYLWSMGNGKYRFETAAEHKR